MIPIWKSKPLWTVLPIYRRLSKFFQTFGFVIHLKKSGLTPLFYKRSWSKLIPCFEGSQGLFWSCNSHQPWGWIKTWLGDCQCFIAVFYPLTKSEPIIKLSTGASSSGGWGDLCAYQKVLEADCLLQNKDNILMCLIGLLWNMLWKAWGFD